jgi:hypothetical protein
MAWRIHLSNQALQHLDILPGKAPVLVVWLRRSRVQFYDLDTGTFLEERRIVAPVSSNRQAPAWQEFIARLGGPDSQTFLPHVALSGLDIYLSDDGKLRLYQVGEADLFLEMEGTEYRLEVENARRVVALDLDRALGMIAALDDTGKLHLYQQNIRLGVFDMRLSITPDQRPAVAIARGGGSIYVTDGHQLVLTDSSGAIQQSLELHYEVGRLACSPVGGMLAISDTSAGVIRLYRGEDLQLTHQKFAVDLVANATQVQLMAELPPLGATVSALAAYARGMVAFAMSGVVCVSEVGYMDALPQPRPLL